MRLGIFEARAANYQTRKATKVNKRGAVEAAKFLYL